MGSSQVNSKELINAAELARRLGISRAAVTGAIKRGKLHNSVQQMPNGSLSIDVDLACIEWPEAAERIKRPAGKRSAALESDDEELQKFKKEAERTASTKRKKEEYDTELVRVKVERIQGKLVSTDEVRKAGFAIAAQVRNHLMNLPERLAAEFAAESDDFVIHKKLKEEINRALEGLAELGIVNDSEADEEE